MYYINLNKDAEPRFDLDKFMEFIEGDYDVLSSYFLYALRDLPAQGVIKITERPFRPELIPWKTYNSTAAWEVLMFYNNVFDCIEDLQLGTELSYPSLQSLEQLYFRLKALSLKG